MKRVQLFEINKKRGQKEISESVLHLRERTSL